MWSIWSVFVCDDPMPKVHHGRRDLALLEVVFLTPGTCDRHSYRPRCAKNFVLSGLELTLCFAVCH